MHPNRKTSAPEPFTFDNPQQSLATGRNLKVDIRWVLIALLGLGLIAMLLAWHPWSAGADSRDPRTIRVTGQSTVTAEPDQYVFSPVYQFSNADSAAALDALAKKNQSLLDGLKQAGATDKQIRTNADGYRNGSIEPSIAVGEPAPGNAGTGSSQRKQLPTYSLRLTITVTDKSVSQKVQDYLATTAPSGPVTPMTTFSTKQRQQLEDQARDQATKDARSKAEQSAKNLGFSLGNVRSVNDASGLGIYPMAKGGSTMEFAPSSDTTAASLPLHPGENQLDFSVEVEYYLR